MNDTGCIGRQVQAQVKRTKARFDLLKVDTMQKVDLLAASHCNMYTQVLAKYQSAFLLTFERIARHLTAVAESIRSCQYHAFSAVKVEIDPLIHFSYGWNLDLEFRIGGGVNCVTCPQSLATWKP